MEAIKLWWIINSVAMVALTAFSYFFTRKKFDEAMTKMNDLYCTLHNPVAFALALMCAFFILSWVSIPLHVARLIKETK